MHRHQPHCVRITCPDMLSHNSTEPLSCQNFRRLMVDNETSESLLGHLECFVHFKDEYSELPACRLKEKCTQFQNVIRGEREIRDLCHLKLFRHPPRQSRVNLSANVAPMLLHEKRSENVRLNGTHRSSDFFRRYCRSAGRYSRRAEFHGTQQFQKDGILQAQRIFVSGSAFRNAEFPREWEAFRRSPAVKALEAEVIANGFESDLSPLFDDEIMRLLNHPRHLAVGSPLDAAQMLSLLLYTGTYLHHKI